MAHERSKRRVLLASGEDVYQWLHDTFAQGKLARWELHHANNLERARFLVQLGVWDAVLADESLFTRGSKDSLAWLTFRHDVPVIFLGRTEADMVAEVLTAGVRQWLPRDLVLEQPGVLVAALEGLVGKPLHTTPASRPDDALHECRQQVDRLLDLLWQAAPRTPHLPWFTQSHMMQRLQEETERARRYGNPVSVILGEVRQERHVASTAPAKPSEATDLVHARLSEWVADQIHRTKRRSDVAGQYGPDGFMLLLAQTPPAGAVEFCERLSIVLQHGPSPVPGRLHACFGVAGREIDIPDPKRLLRRAEEHLDRARTGDRQVVG